MLKDYYDFLAGRYDQEIAEMDKLSIFPYAGYSELLSEVARYLEEHSKNETLNILDLGIGTGELYTKLMPEQIKLHGVDFSPAMLEIAKLKIPNAHLFEYDFLKGIPEKLEGVRFEYIISTYCVHHLNVDALIDFIHYYLRFLSPLGKIILADVFFLDDLSKKKTRESKMDSWDLSHYYHIYNQLVSKIKDHLEMSFMRVSESSGIIIVENYHECALQYEKNLVKYKSNTTKWKSTLVPDKSE